MAVKTFTTGEVLTAADTNTYLNNGGLVYIKSQTIGTTVTSVTVTSAFSSEYDNYKIIVAGGSTGTGNAGGALTLGATATGYYQAGKYRTYAGVDNNLTFANVASFYAVETSVNGLTGIIEVMSPNLAARTNLFTSLAAIRTDGYWLDASGFLDNATQYTAFTITFTGATQTGGTITVYGYRKA